MGLLDII
jgi:hypothetical protein